MFPIRYTARYSPPACGKSSYPSQVQLQGSVAPVYTKIFPHYGAYKRIEQVRQQLSELQVAQEKRLSASVPRRLHSLGSIALPYAVFACAQTRY